ncbi:MAG: cation:proton antiporter [Candidatus Pacearchaeota archaeon]|jgi:Kef-type K+ transport system membrane component KefB/Trk K+ transport system NAD-binding subunit
MEQIFIQLAGILFIAFVISYIARAFRQPVIIGYILSGVVIVFLIKFNIIDIGNSQDVINIFSKFGIAFLLFIVGLHMNPKVIREVGTSSLLIGLAQIILTIALGFLVSFSILKFNLISSLFIGIALSFSSTIIVMKLLSDKRQLDSLYGKISVGILIIQDLVAIGVLMFISSLSERASLISFALKGLIGGSALIILLFLAGYLILPRLTRNIAKSQELLFLFSITFCFIIAALFSSLGFSIEIGSLIAGVVLSISPYSTEISSKIRPLRDFFLIIFFIILGLNINVASIPIVIFNALILSVVALIFKPGIIMALMAIMGYTKRTNFFVGTTLSQISEFSIIVLLLVSSTSFFTQAISNEVVDTIALTLVLTIFFSTYMVIYSNGFYKKIFRFISFFERKKIKKERKVKNKYDAILFGYNRIGFSILRSLKKIKKDYLVVDFNPDTIADLTKLRIPCLYGDIDDVELLDDLPLEKMQLAISTIPDYEINILLIEEIRRLNKDAIIIVRSHQLNEAMELYRKGADYVLTPHFLGGEYVANMIRDKKTKQQGYREEKDKHIKMLKKMIQKGHEHPEVERN